MLQELNRRVLENPNYVLPEGYMKTVEKEMVLHYSVPYCLNISEGRRVAVEMIDELVNELFDFHFLEPVATFQTMSRVRPSLKKLTKPAPTVATIKRTEKTLKPLMLSDSPQGPKKRKV